MSAQPQHLVIDGGKSKTAAMLVDGAGAVIARSTGRGLEIIASPDGERVVAETLRLLLEPLPMPAEVGTVCAGLNGVHAPAVGVDQAAAVLRSLVRAERCIVASDVVPAYVGALGVRPGVVVAAGTGAVVLAVGADGRAHRIDGHGPSLGDRGSGFEIGREGLAEALRVADGLPGSAALHEQLRKVFGDADRAVEAVYGSENQVRTVAAFSRNVAAAARAGDRVARALWASAGRSLAASAVAAAERAGVASTPFAVSWAGGLFGAGALLSGPFGEELRRLAPSARLVRPAGGALDGAAVLARRSTAVLTDVSAWLSGTPHTGQLSATRTARPERLLSWK